MTHRYIDEFRHAKLLRRSQPFDSVDLPNPTPDEVPSWASFDHADVVRAARQLPKHSRVPFELRAFSRLSYRAIASRLDLPMNTVATRIHRARLQIREMLRPAGEN